MNNAIVKFQPKRNQIYAWDALQLAQHMPSESVNCIVSSPPYYGLRDYGVDGQTGLEDTPEQYVAGLVRLFRELRRVLRDDGTLWLNLGDTYSNAGKWGGSSGYDNKQSTNVGSIRRTARNAKDIGAKEKDLLGIPWMVAFALRADGWYLRSDIIWSKPNPMPESVTDRPTKAHEYIFLLTKSPRYWYDADVIREPNSTPGGTLELNTHHWSARPNNGAESARGIGGYRFGSVTNGRNRRTVWEVTTKPFTGSHFATFPEDLIEPMILAGCPKTVCAKCGAPYQPLVEIVRESSWERRKADGHVSGNDTPAMAQQKQGSMSNPADRAEGGFGLPKLTSVTGWKPACTCGASTRAGLVYDPFMGAGTTGLVAQRLGRDYLGSELNPEYAAMARARIDGRMNEYLAMKAGKPYMEGLFEAV